MVHVDTKRLPLIKGQKATDKREYLFVAIDDFSRELYAAIMPDKTASSAAKFLLEEVIEPCPYLIECVYSDNGTEYKGTPHHPFGLACFQNKNHYLAKCILLKILILIFVLFYPINAPFLSCIRHHL